MPAPSPGETQQAVRQFFAAARSGDRTAFAEATSTVDPSFSDRARLLFTNLSRLPLTELAATVDGETQPVTPARRQIFGPGAWMQAVTLRWQLRGEQRPAEHRVWLTLVADEGVRVAGAYEPPPAAGIQRQPLWWRGPVTSVASADTLVVVGSGEPAARWSERAEQAQEQLQRHLPPELHTARSPLVVQVPATTADFEAVLGVPAGTQSSVAAATLADGPSGESAVRVVVNPAAAERLTATGLAVTLSHEAVHASTRSPASSAPIWAVEGLADYVALRAHPSAAAGVFAPLRTRLREQRTVVALPPDSAFAVDAADLDVTYATAWSLCAFVAENDSPARLAALYAALDQGRSLDQGSRAVLGVSEADLLRAWRRDLTRRAEV